MATYAVGEWRFKGPLQNNSPDSACFYFEVNKQQWPGYYVGDGQYAVRYAPKQAEKSSYLTHSTIPELNGLRGSYSSIGPWPGKPVATDFIIGKNWYSDLADPAWMLDGQQGAKTIAQFREAFLMDWAERWNWLKND